MDRREFLIISGLLVVGGIQVYRVGESSQNSVTRAEGNELGVFYGESIFDANDLRLRTRPLPQQEPLKIYQLTSLGDALVDPISRGVSIVFPQVISNSAAGPDFSPWIRIKAKIRDANGKQLPLYVYISIGVQSDSPHKLIPYDKTRTFLVKSQDKLFSDGTEISQSQIGKVKILK